MPAGNSHRKSVSGTDFKSDVIMLVLVSPMSDPMKIHTGLYGVTLYGIAENFLSLSFQPENILLVTEEDETLIKVRVLP
jgi:hypothetical protein